MRLISVSGPAPGKILDFNNSWDYPSPLAIGTQSPLQPGTPFLAVPMDGVDTTANVANWGPSEVVMAFNNSGSAVAPGRLVHLDKDFNISDVPNTGLTGRPVYVTLTNFAIGSTTRQAGWLLRAGICPVQFAVACTTGAVYISATTGQATPTNPTGGKQLCNATALIAGASTFTRTVVARNASKQLYCPSGVKGMYIGQAISTAGNTPVPAGTTISAIATDGFNITVSAASVASGSATATLTNTNFGIVHVDRPFISGSIT